LVAMVTLGDVSVYSTASYVRQLLEEKGYETRVAAGVPSFCAGAAKAKQSLCENGETLGILPGVASREVLEQAFDEFDNLVIMKAGRALSWLLPLLEERGLLEHTTMLRDVGMASEYVGSPQAEPYSYFTTLLIRQRGE
ncbi:MAG: precorrin-2 C(20)-methyltransferase, partial [Ruminococcus sp.]